MEKTQATEHTQLAIGPRQDEELPRPGASLMCLPLELIIEICSRLCCHGQPGNVSHPDQAASRAALSGQTALSALTRTCRLLRTVAEPFLYHHVRFSTTPNFHLFIRSLVERPQLRLEVCEATITVPLEPPKLRVYPSRKISHDTIMAETIEEPLITGDWAPLWNHLVSENRPPDIDTGGYYEQYPALNGLLMRLAPNLRSISFCGESPLSYHGGYMRALNRWNAALPAKSVTRLSLIVHRPSRDYYVGFELEDFAHILQAVPNLEVLHLHGCNTGIPNHLRAVFSQIPIMRERRIKNLTELVLVDCYVTSLTLIDLLMEVGGPNLSRVIIRQGEGHLLAPVKISALERILNALQRLLGTQTLRELTYRFSHQEHGMPEQLEPLPLPAFHALEVLDIATDSIDFHILKHLPGAFANCLPPSLRRLGLAGNAHLTLAMEGMLDARVSGRLPNLTTIELNEQNDWYDSLDFPDQDRGMIAAVAGLRSTGVEIIVHPLGHEF
jgi:hypothetical protein